MSNDCSAQRAAWETADAEFAQALVDRQTAEDQVASANAALALAEQAAVDTGNTADEAYQAFVACHIGS